MSPGRQAELETKAEFCLVTGIAPSEYDALTDDERDTFIAVFNRLRSRKDD